MAISKFNRKHDVFLAITLHPNHVTSFIRFIIHQKPHSFEVVKLADTCNCASNLFEMIKMHSSAIYYPPIQLESINHATPQKNNSSATLQICSVGNM